MVGDRTHVPRIIAFADEATDEPLRLLIQSTQRQQPNNSLEALESPVLLAGREVKPDTDFDGVAQLLPRLFQVLLQ
jgi:hypothetical protein